MSEQAGTSRLTNEHQVTIPTPVREALKLEAGDTVAFDIFPGQGVHLRKADAKARRFVEADQKLTHAKDVARATEPLTGADEGSFHNL